VTSGSGRSRGLLPGMLIAFGIQTTLLFASLEFTVYPLGSHLAGGYIGLLGGLILLSAGLIGLAGTRTPAPAAITPGVPGLPGATVPGPGPAGS
jgi:hypothetical protein